MSAANPITESEKKARAWAVELDQTPEQILRWILRLREKLPAEAAAANEAWAAWRKLVDVQEQTASRIEALKHRLVTEL